MFFILFFSICKKKFYHIFLRKMSVNFPFHHHFSKAKRKNVFLYNILQKIWKYKNIFFSVLERFSCFLWSSKWSKNGEKRDFASFFSRGAKLNIGWGVWKGTRFENEHFSEKMFFIEKSVFPRFESVLNIFTVDLDESSNGEINFMSRTACFQLFCSISTIFSKTCEKTVLLWKTSWLQHIVR